MQVGNGIKLFLMFVVGFLLIEAGLNGNPGSLLGALITPEYMQQSNSQTGGGGGSTF